jgi:maltooligosyltrehalose trehalohydrolase
MFRFHRMPFGAELTDGGTRFALWAPTAHDVALVLDGERLAMPDEGGGWRRLIVPEARAGARYRYLIDGTLEVPDPASRFQPEDVFGPSQVVDPRAYSWTQSDWKGRPWEEAVLYEVHVGTATPEGTFAALQEHLSDLAALGITAIQLMPLADVPGGRNWGYDGVLPFAPDAAYGTPDDLKRLVDRAHQLGLMVFLDVVYNHFGPSGNYLNAYAKTFFTDRHQTPWGAAVNFDGDGSATVRDFFICNAIYWLEEFYLDGLRFDAVHAIFDDGTPHILDSMADHIRSHFSRAIHLVLENEANEASRLERGNDAAPLTYTAQWADDVHNAWHVILTGERDGYYGDFVEHPVEHLGRALAEGFSYQGETAPHLGRTRGEASGHLPPQAFVSFLQNHDQIGNRALGERLCHIVADDKLDLARAVLLLSPQIPLLFMGEDWSASSPFQFFVDFPDQALCTAVRDGRRREFSKFAGFAANEDRVPDPTALETFQRSKLSWSERKDTSHAAILAEFGDLLALRRTEIVPLLKSTFVGGSFDLPHDAALAISWRFTTGQLRLVMNFGDEAVETVLRDGEHLVWSSKAAARGDGGAILLSRWTGAVIASQR